MATPNFNFTNPTKQATQNTLVTPSSPAAPSGRHFLLSFLAQIHFPRVFAMATPDFDSAYPTKPTLLFLYTTTRTPHPPSFPDFPPRFPTSARNRRLSPAPPHFHTPLSYQKHFLHRPYSPFHILFILHHIPLHSSIFVNVNFFSLNVNSMISPSSRRILGPSPRDSPGSECSVRFLAPTLWGVTRQSFVPAGPVPKIAPLTMGGALQSTAAIYRVILLNSRLRPYLPESTVSRPINCS